MTDINKIIKDARNVLVGKVPDPQSQIDQITLALIYKFMDAKDAEAIALGIEPQFFVGECADYSFSKIMQATSNPKQYQMYTQGINLLQKRSDLPETFTNVFKGAFIPYRDASTLHLFLEEINKIPTENTEILGTAFEDLLSIMGSQGDAGQFRTPRHIIDMIVDIVEPKKGETILDPACGTAGFLISAYNKISKQDLTIEEREKLINEGLVGYDINPNMVKLSHVNLFLHGCKKPNIHLYDTLSDKDFWKDNYDVILANPPFMTPRGGIRPHELFSAINANRSEVLFTYYIAKHLKSNGRAGIIVPEGIVFQSANAYKNLRAMLVEENYLYAVISLPAGVFNPYSGVKTSVLLFDKALARRTDKILFVKMNSDGFDLGAQRRPIEKNDIPEIVKIVKRFAFCVSTESENDFVDESGLSVFTDKNQIAQNDYVLVGDRYKIRYQVNSKYEIVKLGDIYNTASGGTPLSTREEYYLNGNIPWLTSGEVSNGFIFKARRYITKSGLENSSAKIFPVNTVVVAMYGATAGQVGILKSEMATNQAVCGILPDERVVPEYLYYILKSLKDKMISNSVGGAQPNISQRIIRNLEIPLPPTEIQEQIVSEIESYQKIIDGAKQVVENYRPTIKVETSWKMVKLGDVIEINPKKTEVNNFDGYVSFVPMSDLNENNMYFYPNEQRKIHDVYMGYTYFMDGDVLLAKVTPCFENGKSGVAKGLVNGIGFGSSEFYVLRADLKQILPEFIYYIIHSNNFISQGKANMTGTGGLQRLTKDYVLNYIFFLPPIEDQKQIINKINLEMSIVEQNKRLIQIFEQKIKDKINEVWGNGAE